MRYSMILARNNKGVIGDSGAIPWYLPEDLKLFKDHTLRKAVIMGRNTWESLPKRPLEQRLNIVVSTTMQYPSKPDYVVARDIKAATRHAEMAARRNRIASEIMYIGGAAIYKEAVKFVHRVYLTEVQNDMDGDTLFDYDFNENFLRKSTETHDGFNFSIFDRIR